MQITIEKVVWIALILVVVAVVGLFLMGQVLTASKQVGQRFYVRLISSQWSDAANSYIISLRIVNTGEAGANITKLTFKTIGFGNGTIVLANGTDIASGYSVTIVPKEARDITIEVGSNYVSGSKSLVITADFSDGKTSSQSVEIP